MYISHKSNIVQSVSQSEWRCRMESKGMSLEEYWAWEKSITETDADGKETIEYPSEDFSIVECTIAKEDILTRLAELRDYIDNKTYNIKWSDEKVDGSHLNGDDSAKDARILADEWVKIRAKRDRLIAETDWMMLSDTGTVSTAWKNYRKALREIPQSQDSVKKYADIDWPDKPSS